MWLLDFIDPKPYYKPPTGNFRREDNEEARDKELNNFDRKQVTEDFGDSNFADRVWNTLVHLAA